MADLPEEDAYAKLSWAFDRPAYVVLYLAAVAFVGLHLHHAIWSMCQTLGWDRPNRNAFLRRLSGGLSLLLVVAFALMPIVYGVGALPDPPPSQPPPQAAAGAGPEAPGGR